MPKAWAPPRYRLTYRGRWLLIAALVSLVVWALVMYLGANLLGL